MLGAGTRLPVRSLIGAQLALSPVDGRRVPGNCRVPQNSCWTSPSQASGAVTRQHLGCISDLSKIADTRMVHQ